MLLVAILNFILIFICELLGGCLHCNCNKRFKKGRLLWIRTRYYGMYFCYSLYGKGYVLLKKKEEKEDG